MIFPTVHLNGTSADTLLEMHKAMYADLTKALATMQENGPNARDYYVAGPDAFRAAAREHQRRLDHVRLVREEIMAIAENIQKQVDDRQRR